MTKYQPNPFYFCGEELPLYSDYWWAISRDLFEDYHDLCFWEKQLCSYFNEIEWKLDKDRMPYSFDAEIFKICCLLLLKHIYFNTENTAQKLTELDFDSEVFIENLTQGLLSMIEISDQHETVWWINGGEEEKQRLQEMMQNGEAPHEIERKHNLTSSIESLSKELRKLSQGRHFDKATKRKINDVFGMLKNNTDKSLSIEEMNQSIEKKFKI